MTHSPEPWKVDKALNNYVFVVDANDKEIVHDHGRSIEDGWSFDPADAERIVACVNFCHGIQTDMLKEALKAWSPTKGPLSDARQAYWRLRYALRGDE